MAEDQGLAAFKSGQVQAASASDEKDSAEGMAKRAVVAAERLLQAFISFLPKVSGAGENSAMSGMEPDKALNLFKPIAAPFGGAKVGDSSTLAKVFGPLMKLNFSVQNPAIEGIPIQAAENVSMASLGTFTPDFTPSQGMSRGGAEMMA